MHKPHNSCPPKQKHTEIDDLDDGTWCTSGVWVEQIAWIETSSAGTVFFLRRVPLREACHHEEVVEVVKVP